ncbi:MAG: SxtJ family membrane protein [Bacteroidota bacterium]
MKLPKIIVTQLSRKQLLETSLVLIVLGIISGFVQDQSRWFVASAVVAGTGLVVPKLLYPVAVVWFTLGNVLSQLVSPLLLTLVFLLMITPIGIIRRWLGRDSLQLRWSKSDNQTMLKERTHTFTASDLKNSF